MTLYVVATPIGNLGDVSMRARNVCEEATLVLAEDTRTAKKLFNLLGIATNAQFLSSHAQSSEKELKRTLETCSRHECIVLVTDAGTPAISDPGIHLIAHFRTHYPTAAVLPIPGPSAAIAALSVSGFPSSHFEFLGFIPHKKGRKTLLEYIGSCGHTVVVYESPHRIIKTLASMAELFPERMIMVGREMTKQFEEYPRGTVLELYRHYLAHTEKIRGEFTIVIAPVTKIKNLVE